MRFTKGHTWLALHKLFPSSPKTLRVIAEALDGDVGQIRTLSEASLVEIFGQVPGNKLLAFPSVLKEVKEDWDDLRKLGVNLIPFTDRRYPEKLKHVKEFPPLLYTLGNLSLLKDAAVGICGSRDASNAGLRNAMKFGVAGAKLGLVVVSGYAKGVDTAAHLGAINAKGRTIVVLPEGINRFKKKGLFKDVGDFFERTLVISQFYPTQIWRVSAAMERNGLICGVSNAVAIIEASPTGGTIAAGRECLAQGKPLWVIDYDGLPATASGNRILITEGGSALRSVREWVFALYNVHANFRGTGRTKKLTKANGQVGEALDKMQLALSIDNLGEQIELFASAART